MAGGDPILFPTIEILPPENPGAVRNLIERLDGFQLAIFVSPTAAMRGHELVSASRSWPEGLRVAAGGNGNRKRARGTRVPFGDCALRRGRQRGARRASRAAGSARALDRDLSRAGRPRVAANETRSAGARESSTPNATAARVPTPTQEGCSPDGKAAGSKRSLSPAPKAWRISSTCWAPTGRGYLRATPVFVPHPRIAACCAQARRAGDRRDRARRRSHRSGDRRFFC